MHFSILPLIASLAFSAIFSWVEGNKCIENCVGRIELNSQEKHVCKQGCALFADTCHIRNNAAECCKDMCTVQYRERLPWEACVAGCGFVMEDQQQPRWVPGGHVQQEFQARRIPRQGKLPSQHQQGRESAPFLGNE